MLLAVPALIATITTAAGLHSAASSAKASPWWAPGDTAAELVNRKIV